MCFHFVWKYFDVVKPPESRAHGGERSSQDKNPLCGRNRATNRRHAVSRPAFSLLSIRHQCGVILLLPVPAIFKSLFARFREWSSSLWVVRRPRLELAFRRARRGRFLGLPPERMCGVRHIKRVCFCPCEGLGPKLGERCPSCAVVATRVFRAIDYIIQHQTASGRG